MTRTFALAAIGAAMICTTFSCGGNIGGPAVFDTPDDGQPPEACRSWFYDHDRDGHGDPNTVATICGIPAGYVSVGDDCDDGDARVFPGASEICGDGRRQDCNRSEDLQCAETPDAGQIASNDAGVCGVCDAGFSGDAGSPSVDAGFSYDAGSISDAGSLASDAGGVSADASADAGEICPPSERVRWYRDADGDGYGRNDQSVEACASNVIGYSRTSGDCDDTNASVYTGCVVADAGVLLADAGSSSADAGDSSSDAGAVSSDAGAFTDAGVLTDAGVSYDAGSSSADAGSFTDAGTLTDAGLPVDAGLPPATDAGSESADAGATFDAGSPTNDAGSSSDAGVSTDAGSALDAGFSADAGSLDAGTAPDPWSSYVRVEGRSVILSAMGMGNEPFMSAPAFIVGDDNGVIDWTFKARNSVTPASGAFTIDFTDLVKWPPGEYEFTLVSSVNGNSQTVPDISAVVRWWKNDDLCNSGSATARAFCVRQPRPAGASWDSYLLRVQVTQTAVLPAGTL